MYLFNNEDNKTCLDWLSLWICMKIIVLSCFVTVNECQPVFKLFSVNLQWSLHIISQLYYFLPLSLASLCSIFPKSSPDYQAPFDWRQSEVLPHYFSLISHFCPPMKAAALGVGNFWQSKREVWEYLLIESLYKCFACTSSSIFQPIFPDNLLSNTDYLLYNSPREAYPASILQQICHLPSHNFSFHSCIDSHFYWSLLHH